MPTKNPRINLTFEAETAHLLSCLAKEEQKSVAGVTKELVLEALERREDKYLSAVARERDTKKAKRIKHKDVW